MAGKRMSKSQFINVFAEKTGMNKKQATVTLDMLALGLIAPVLPKLVLNFLGGDASNAAKMFGVFGTVFALMQFVFSPVLGVAFTMADFSTVWNPGNGFDHGESGQDGGHADCGD